MPIFSITYELSYNMSLTHSQKRFLKKNFKKMSVEHLVVNLGISESEIREYLKDRSVPEVQTTSREDIFSFGKFMKQNWIYCVGLILLILITYFNGINNAFLSDDIAAISQNPNIGYAKGFLASPFGIARNILFYSVFHVGGLTPGFYRGLNILFHIGSTFAVLLIVARLVGRKIALFVATIFAVHPLLAESVTWISGGPYAQYSFFALTSFFLYLLANKKKSMYVVSIICFIISLFTTEKAVAVFGLFFIYEFALGLLKKNWRKLIPYFIATAIFASFYISGIGTGRGYLFRVTALQHDYYEKTGIDNPLTQIPIAITSYFELFFWPDGLSLYHSELRFTPVQFTIRALVFLIYLGILIYSFKKNRKIFFWLSFFFISLGPTLLPLKVSWVYAERYVYLGTLGLITATILPFQKFIDNKKYQWATYTIFAIIVGALAIRTIIRNADWASEDSLWVATARTSPSSPTNHNNLGDMYYRHGENEKAIREFKTAILLKPGYADAYHNIGNVYYKMGRLQDALNSYYKALELNPNLWQSYQNIAIISFEQKKYAEAEKNMLKATQLSPGNVDLTNNLGIIYLNTGQSEKAKKAFLMSLQINPKDEVANKYIKMVK